MKQFIEHISVVIIAKNSEATILNCLSSLSLFKEVILYLNDSTDQTESIALNFPNVVVFKGPFFGFGPTKQKAISLASNNWILSLDSDEVLDDLLIDNLIKTNLSNQCIYSFRRVLYYKKKKINFCGLDNEKIMRLFNREKTNFNNQLVHERIVVNNLNLKFLSGNIKHYSFNSISDFIQKIDSYSSLYSEQSSKYASPFLALIKSIVCFLKIYFLKLGFLDGYVGFLISYSSATGVLYKYLKLYEKNNNL